MSNSDQNFDFLPKNHLRGEIFIQKTASQY